MHNNRIQRFQTDNYAYTAAFAQHAGYQQQSVQTLGSGTGATMVVVPGVVAAPWQTHVYRLAYEKALADTAPPRHFARFFSVWN